MMENNILCVRIAQVVADMKTKGINLTVKNVVTQSLFSKGGTLAGNEAEIKAYIEPLVFDGKIYYYPASESFESLENDFAVSSFECYPIVVYKNEKDANVYGDRVIPVSLNVLNPVDLRTQSIFNNKAQASHLWCAVSYEVLSESEALDKINEEISLGEISDFKGELLTYDGAQTLEGLGYDAIISTVSFNHNIQVTLFHPSQITIL